MRAEEDTPVLLCANCHDRPGTEIWADSALHVAHGLQAQWCKRCVLREQLKHAQEQAARIPDLQRALAEEA